MYHAHLIKLILITSCIVPTPLNLNIARKKSQDHAELSEVKSFSRVQLFVTPWTVAYQPPPSVGFSRQEYWKGLPVQFSSVTQSCPTLCDPMNHSTPGLPVHHQLLEFTHTHVHQVSDAIQPSHPLSSPSPSAPNPSQHQSLFQ